MASIWKLISLSIFFILIVYFIICLKNYIKIWKAIKKIPGPPTFNIFGNLPQIMCDKVDLWTTLRKFSKEFTNIHTIWSGPVPTVTLISPEDVEMLIYSMKHSKKSILYNILEPWLGTGLLTSAGEKWQFRRKLLTPAFHFNILQQFMEIFTEESLTLIEKLKTETQKASIDIVPYITEFTLRTICETAMGVKMNWEEKSQESYREAIHRMGESVCFRAVRPWYYLDWLFCLSKESRMQRKIAGILHKFSRNVIQNRIDTFDGNKVLKLKDTYSPKVRLAMLDLLLFAKQTGSKIDEEGIREEVDTFMFEGHDTTAMAICFTLMLLACNPDVQNLVVEELNIVFKEETFCPSHHQLQELKYLERVIKESLRLFPSVPFISRITTEDMVTPTGYYIPKGVFVHVSIYDMHRNPKYFPNPEKFDPDRFLPENSHSRHPFVYIPFSAGPRNCIGQKFALLELKIVLSAILKNFVLLPVDNPNTLTYCADLVMRTLNGIRIKVRPRN